MTDLLEFLNRLSDARVAKALPNKRIKGYAGGAASPYKAILLLVIFQKIRNSESEFSDGIIRYSKCVKAFEELYRSVFDHESVDELHQKIVQPFWNLGTGNPKLWKLVPNKDALDELRCRMSERKQVKSQRILNTLVDYAESSRGDTELLRDEIANDAVRGFVITTHFQERGSTAFNARKTI